MLSPLQRFWDRVSRKSDGCWIWTGYVINSGYGQFCYKGRQGLAHRVSYEMNVGVIPDGLVIDHLCCVKLCVNPDHLEAVTYKENNDRAGYYNANKTHCDQGHEYTDENTRRYPGRRYCRACERVRASTHRVSRNAAARRIYAENKALAQEMKKALAQEIWG